MNLQSVITPNGCVDAQKWLVASILSSGDDGWNGPLLVMVTFYCRIVFFVTTSPTLPILYVREKLRLYMYSFLSRPDKYYALRCYQYIDRRNKFLVAHM